VAVGTDLLYAAITKAGGTLAHGLKGTVDWTITRRLAYGSIPAAALTLLVLGQVAPGGIGGATGSSRSRWAWRCCSPRWRSSSASRSRTSPSATRRAREPAPHRHLTVVTGAVLGVLVSISSVGAGALGVSALFFLYPRLPTLRIVGSDIAHAVPLTLVAGIGHWFLGSVDWSLLGSLLIGSLPGIWLGSHISTRVPDRVLRPILAGMLVLVGSKLIAA
jgi:uncharacterized membrane protein YfcA